MKTIKIYFALYRDKVRDKVVNSDGVFMRTKEYISVPSKKNSQTPLVSKSTGKSFLKKSNQFINWYKLAYPTMLNEKQKIEASGISLPIYRARITVVYYFPNEMARDLTNKYCNL